MSGCSSPRMPTAVRTYLELNGRGWVLNEQQLAVVEDFTDELLRAEL